MRDGLAGGGKAAADYSCERAPRGGVRVQRNMLISQHIIMLGHEYVDT